MTRVLDAVLAAAFLIVLAIPTTATLVVTR
jgi:hypothetical protein